MLGALAYAEMTNGKTVTRDGDPVNGAAVVIASAEMTPGVRATMFGIPMIKGRATWAPFNFTPDELSRDDWRVA